MKQAVNFIESVFSFAIFAAITLAIAGTTYQLFRPDGGLAQWLAGVWNTNPVVFILLGVITLLVKRWLGNAQGGQSVDVLFYGAILLGLYYGFNLLLAA